MRSVALGLGVQKWEMLIRIKKSGLISERKEEGELPLEEYASFEQTGEGLRAWAFILYLVC
jgi:hypothetical protein